MLRWSALALGKDTGKRADDGRKQKVERKFRKEIKAGAADHEEVDQRRARNEIALQRSAHKGEPAENEQAGIDDGCGGGGEDRSCEGRTVALDQLQHEAVDKSCAETGKRALPDADEGRGKGLRLEENVGEHIGPRNTCDQRHQTEDKSEQRTCARSEQNRSDGDGNENEAYARRPDMDERSKQLKQNDDGDEQAQLRQRESF